MTDDPDELRRRLYRPDASADDVARYRAVAPAPTAVLEPDPAETPTPTPSARRRAPLLAAAAVALVLAAGGAVLVALGPRPPAPPPAPRFSADAGVTTLVASATDRTRFAAALAAGRSAGVLHFLLLHPDRIPAAIRTVTRADSDERSGTGPAQIALDPSPAAKRGGELTVMLTIDRSTAAGWSVMESAGEPSQRLDDPVDAHRITALAGLPAVATFRYEAPAPQVLEIMVPAGVRWDAAFTFTD